MEYSVQKLSKYQVEIAFDINKEEWAACIKEAYQANRHKYKLDGFRTGKVPQNVLENRYGKEVFYEDALDIALPKYYGEILDKETGIEPISRPDVDVKEVSDDGVKVVLGITIKPEFTLGQYTGLDIEKAKVEIKDEDVEKVLTKRQEEMARLVDISDRAVVNGDEVTIDYSGSVDGVKFDGGTAEGQTLIIGSGMFIPGFEEQVIDMNINDQKEIKVTFPKEYGASNLAGKDAIFAVKLHKISKKELPSIDDELAKDSGEFETLAEYKANIREELEKNATRKAEYEDETKIIDKICENTEIDLPDEMVNQELDTMIENFEQRLTMQGLKMEDFLKYTGSTIEQFKETRKEEAKRSLKSRMIIEEIVKKENMKLNSEDIDAKAAELAKANNVELEEFKKSMNEQQFNQIANEVLSDKLFNFLKANNNIK